MSFHGVAGPLLVTTKHCDARGAVKRFANQNEKKKVAEKTGGWRFRTLTQTVCSVAKASAVQPRFQRNQHGRLALKYRNGDIAAIFTSRWTVWRRNAPPKVTAGLGRACQPAWQRREDAVVVVVKQHTHADEP